MLVVDQAIFRQVCEWPAITLSCQYALKIFRKKHCSTRLRHKRDKRPGRLVANQLSSSENKAFVTATPAWLARVPYKEIAFLRHHANINTCYGSVVVCSASL